MVTQPPERKADADYSLSRVHELAGRDSVRFAYTRVQADIANLGYGQDEVCSCLSALQASDFSHSERYTSQGKWHDVYKISWRLSARAPDHLYVKFRMDDDVLVIELCSFHQHR